MEFTKIVLISFLSTSIFAYTTKAQLSPQCFFGNVSISGTVACPNNSSLGVSGATVALESSAGPLTVFYNQTTTNSNGSFVLNFTPLSCPPFPPVALFPNGFYLNATLPNGICSGYASGTYLIYNQISLLQINSCLYGANNPAVG